MGPGERRILVGSVPRKLASSTDRHAGYEIDINLICVAGTAPRPLEFGAEKRAAVGLGSCDKDGTEYVGVVGDDICIIGGLVHHAHGQAVGPSKGRERHQIKIGQDFEEDFGREQIKITQ